jgi:hypothetical protein
MKIPTAPQSLRLRQSINPLLVLESEMAAARLRHRGVTAVDAAAAARITVATRPHSVTAKPGRPRTALGTMAFAMTVIART